MIQTENNLMNLVSATELEELLCRLISLESHKESKIRENAVVDFMIGYFQTNQIEVEKIPVLDGRCNVMARITGIGNGPTVLLNGHTDTVPAFDMKNPFQPESKDGKIYGRGSVDMKGALAAMMGVMLYLKRTKTPLQGDVVFAATIGEEEYSAGAEFLVRNELTADYAIVGEPTELQVGIAHKGIFWGEAVFGGKAVHGSVPEKGSNAIHHAGRWLEWFRIKYLPKLKQKQHPLLGSPTANVGVINGGKLPVMVPDRCSIEFERRLLPGETVEAEIAALNKELKNVFADAREVEAFIRELPVFHGVPHPYLETKENAPMVDVLLQVTADELNQKTTPIGLPFWTDAALLNTIPGLQAVVCGPGNIEQAHSNDEWISQEQLHAAYRVYVKTALRLCGQPIYKMISK